MKIVVSNWAWLPVADLSESQINRMKDRLIIYPKKTSEHQQSDPKPLELFVEKKDFFGIPRNFFVQENQKSGRQHEIQNKTSLGKEANVVFQGQLKEDQPDAVRIVLDNMQSGNFGGIIQALPGYGKTIVALNIWAASKRNAIVIVQKQFLVDQWIERITQFIPGARIGRIQQDRCEYGSDFDISIAMMQTLISRVEDYPQEFWDAFGLFIFDECHHASAPQSSVIVPMFTSGYRLGLTATPRRKDGADDVFFWHLGPVIYRSKLKTVIPRLRRIFTQFQPIKTRTFDLDKMSKEIQVRHICKNPNRNKLIVAEVLKAIEAGRKILLLSERRKHLEILKEMFDTQKPVECISDFYIGGMKKEDLEKASKANVIFSTYQMTKEGFDLPSLDTILLTTPISDVEQAVGRIMRECDGKKSPIVTDFIDEKIGRFVGLWNRRRMFYVKEGMFDEKSKN